MPVRRLMGLLGLAVIAPLWPVRHAAAQYASEQGKQLLFLFDVSGTVKDSAIRQEYLKAFWDIVSVPSSGTGAIGLDDPIFAAEISSDPKRIIRLPFSYDPPPFNAFADNRLVYAKRRAAALDSIEPLVLQTKGSAETHILDALELVPRALTLPRRKKVLVIMSDMIEESSDLNLLKAPLTHRQALDFIETRQRNGLLPDLRGVTVWVIGPGVGSVNITPEQERAIQAFWVAYFKATGATLPDGWYGAEPSRVER